MKSGDVKTAVKYCDMNREQRRRYLADKYRFDRAFSLAVLLVLSPWILLTALLVFIDDPHGSPFYSQIRIGEKGRQFRLYKFRTMVVGAEDEQSALMLRNEMHGPAFKIRDDARITRFGKILRKTGIDEIPQFVNVLKGDMSIVGPRPPLPGEAAMYSDYQRKRLAVRPGITCYWQIVPDRNRILFDDWVKLDLKYIRERCRQTDRRIMRLTVRAMLRGQGE